MMLAQSIQLAKEKLSTLREKVITYYEEVLGAVEEKDNIFVFDNIQLLQMARNYLETYERKEALRIIKNKNYLVFTSQIDKPFIRYDHSADEILQALYKDLEKRSGKKLDQIEKAFLEWEIYNDSEERIIERVMQNIFEIELKSIERYLMIKHLRRSFSIGEKILMKDIEGMIGGIKEKRMLLYKYVG